MGCTPQPITVYPLSDLYGVSYFKGKVVGRFPSEGCYGNAVGAAVQEIILNKFLIIREYLGILSGSLGGNISIASGGKSSYIITIK